MNNETRDKALYRYPDSDILKNKLNLRDTDSLNKAERRLVVMRIREGSPTGNFDLQHLQAIHRHLFQDLYEWAGQLRQVDIGKGGHWFMPKERLESGMADIHRRLCEQNRLKGLSADAFADKAGIILGDVNHLHPFREGNGRTQTQYLKQLAAQAGHSIDLRRMHKQKWIEASRASNVAEYAPISACIRDLIIENERVRLRHQIALKRTERGDHER
ncbi:Fic family protein [Maricaulis sp.]|uniref:Fic/DOC family protein n=1 Tax=Maricaulis sp. TaxID=1486257 RepID=UPI001B2CD195|nr:Fic family protein [Maricaulis sp.]MBO6764040.1 Fic family protein [Maricaulis sp.]